MSPLVERAAAAAVGAAAGWCAMRLLPRLAALGLRRSNFRGDSVLTAGGVVFALAALPWLLRAAGPAALTAAAAAAGFGLLGFLDDRWGTAEHRGLRGHLAALRGGRVTTGFVKAGGGLILAGALAWNLHPAPRAAADALLIALSANLFNLLDLRPLRALKLFWLLCAGLVWSGPTLIAAALGVSLPYAREEARCRVMLGDTGANALGGMLGAAAAALLPAAASAGGVALLLLVHLWAEKHSISAWIAAHPVLRALDEWGWRGQGAADAGPPP